MRVSIVVPVWNGASVVPDCLEAVYAHSGDELLEVVCVDNASYDESAALIADRYPHARLIWQPVNLGFAGGVNAGIDAAQGDVFVLLNQDCIVQPGWLAELLRALEVHSEFGIAGCTIVNSDGTLNHAGAFVRRPDAYGVHSTEIGDGEPRPVEYVTGAAMAIRRSTWDRIGRFDEGFYPAYYEDSDYCYRARRKGLETGLVPSARVTHLLSSREWQRDPIKHAANQHFARYRFVCKHFDSAETTAFFGAEEAAAQAERYFDQALGRVIATRDILRNLEDVLARRSDDLGDDLPQAHRRQLRVGFTQVLQRSFSVAEAMGVSHPLVSPLESSADWQACRQRLELLRQREYDLLTRIYFTPRSSDQSERLIRRLFRLLMQRPLSLLTGREHLLLADLNTVHVARMDEIETMDSISRQYLSQLSQLSRRARVLEILTEYDYR